MSRTTQYIGMNQRAIDFISRNNLVKVVNPFNKTTGMFDEDIPLDTYENEHGKRFYEKVQTEPWSSGPMILTCLESEQGAWIEETTWIPSDDPNEWINYKDGKYYI